MSDGYPARRALVVACNFPPDASVGTMRTLRLVRHLVRVGWQADVVTISPDGFRSGTVSDPALLDKVPETVTVLRAKPLRPFERLTAFLKRGGTKTANAAASSTAPAAIAAPPATARAVTPSRVTQVRRAISALLALPDREVSWLLPAVRAGWRRAREARPDVIYSSGPPFTAHLVGYLLSRLAGVPWVADFRDPWARAPWREDRFEFERRAWAIFERFVVTHAQAVVFVTATNRNDFAREYGADVAERFVVVNNGCDPAEFDGLSPAPREATSPFVLLHAGSLYGARNPAGLLRAVATAIAGGGLDRATFRLRFLGRIGIPGVDLSAVARDLGIGEVVEFISHVPRRSSLQQMLDASALLIVQPVTTVSIPAKLYEYMGAGRPILALAEPGGETASLVEATRAGISVSADDDAAIAHGLVAVAQSAREGFTPVDRQRYDGEVRAAELRAVLERVAAAGVRR
jgi:glycosyltransferase involved in cell wall biosynthesis